MIVGRTPDYVESEHRHKRTAHSHTTRAPAVGFSSQEHTSLIQTIVGYLGGEWILMDSVCPSLEDAIVRYPRRGMLK